MKNQCSGGDISCLKHNFLDISVLIQLCTRRLDSITAVGLNIYLCYDSNVLMLHGNVYSLLQVTLKAIVGACLCSFYVFCVQNNEITAGSLV